LHARAFDDLAADYDATFTASGVGSTLRALVWSRLDRAFRPPARILELGCGTGEDAVRLARSGIEVVAVDASPRMIQVARQKAQAPDCGGRIEFLCLPMERLTAALEGQLFDGVLSNFGALNCVPDLATLTADIAARLRPGAPLLWVVMGRYVPWEWLWYSLRGDWSKAWRRLSRGGVSWRGLTIHYPRPADLMAVLRPYFAIERVAPLGFALPPTYAGAWLEHRPRLLQRLTRLEHAAQRISMLAAFSDHYLVEAVRTEKGDSTRSARGASR